MPKPPPPPPQYDDLLIGGLSNMQWTWPWELFSGGLDELLNFIFPVTPPWVQPAYNLITGFVDKIKSWFSLNRANGYEYEDEDEFLADFEEATQYAESETGTTREDIVALFLAGPGGG
jgi:hypothetical protein